MNTVLATERHTGFTKNGELALLPSGFIDIGLRHFYERQDVLHVVVKSKVGPRF